MIEISIRSFTELRAEASRLSRTQAKEGVPSELFTGRGIAVLSVRAAPGPLAEQIGQETRSPFCFPSVTLACRARLARVRCRSRRLPRYIRTAFL
jgi:hypothetical protein